MKKTMILAAVVAAGMLAGCEKVNLSDINNNKEGNVTLTFVPSTADVQTRATVTIGDYFEKLNVMLFDGEGNKAFSQVRTQTREADDDFGQLTCQLTEGTYTVVAVGHSSVKSATIKSPQMVQFTASDGEKLTDTFCYCGTVTVGEQAEQHSLQMHRVGAMVRFHLTDTDIPATFARLKIDYTGGSANFNPTTSEGTTKSTQSENRPRSEAQQYRVYTFPYLAATGTLKMTLTALDADGNTIRQRVFPEVPVSRNRITTYTGPFFSPGDGQFSQTGFGFTIDAEWDGEETFTF